MGLCGRIVVCFMGCDSPEGRGEIHAEGIHATRHLRRAEASLLDLCVVAPHNVQGSPPNEQGVGRGRGRGRGRGHVLTPRSLRASAAAWQGVKLSLALAKLVVNAVKQV
jgi:hypothetical protein